MRFADFCSVAGDCKDTRAAPTAKAFAFLLTDPRDGVSPFSFQADQFSIGFGQQFDRRLARNAGTISGNSNSHFMSA
jgi:hypothetical protein